MPMLVIVQTLCANRPRSCLCVRSFVRGCAGCHIQCTFAHADFTGTCVRQIHEGVLKRKLALNPRLLILIADYEFFRSTSKKHTFQLILIDTRAAI